MSWSSSNCFALANFYNLYAYSFYSLSFFSLASLSYLYLFYCRMNYCNSISFFSLYLTSSVLSHLDKELTQIVLFILILVCFSDFRYLNMWSSVIFAPLLYLTSNILISMSFFIEFWFKLMGISFASSSRVGAIYSTDSKFKSSPFLTW